MTARLSLSWAALACVTLVLWGLCRGGGFTCSWQSVFCLFGTCPQVSPGCILRGQSMGM